jgi:hypothetical protein
MRLKAEMLRNFSVAAHLAGATNLKGLPRDDGEISLPAATRPYQVVEFDGHRLDIRLKVVVSDPLGFEHEFEIERVWLLVIIDVCTRAVLGYHLVMGREYSRYDVAKRSRMPWNRIVLGHSQFPVFPMGCRKDFLPSGCSNWATPHGNGSSWITQRPILRMKRCRRCANLLGAASMPAPGIVQTSVPISSGSLVRYTPACPRAFRVIPAPIQGT